MDKNEVITLSSDEESDFTNRFENSQSSVKTVLKKSPELSLEKIKNITVNKNKCLIILKENSGVKVVNLSKAPEKKQKIIITEYPEVVDLESSEKGVEDEQIESPFTSNKLLNTNEKHSNLDVIEIDEIPNGENTPSNNEINKTDVTNKEVSKLSVVPKNVQTDTNAGRINWDSDQNLKFFTEFVEYCGELEEIPSDRVRLTKKLMKKYGEADSNYIKSQQFRNIIQKCRDKVSKNNLYLIAKEITDELTYRKKLNTGNSNLVKETSQRDEEITVTEKVQESTKKSKKRTKVIKKIIKKLDKLGGKIRELEEEEVNLSDEEESTYVQLQRYRERFWQIYKKLCQYTNEVADADRIANRKISFTESKYPAINRCIENWLNKTKRFPDFSDIMKLLESQSASLGLPSNRESIRVIAIEIFQQVGVMLQRRRKYDLWDSFCGFLDEGEDPAENDPLLDRVLKNNYDIRMRKEEEIFKHFAELQEKELLEPEEVPDDEANHSPAESGNEDDKEIEDIENALNKRLDEAIRKETEENGNNGKSDENDTNSVEAQRKGEKTIKPMKESKNNFKNCKSLKWRLENAKKESGNSEDSTEMERKQENKAKDVTDAVLKCDEKDTVGDAETEFCSHVQTEATEGCVSSPSKRKRDSESEDGVFKKRKCDDVTKEVDSNGAVTVKKASEVFQVHCCQIFASNAFEDLSEKQKDWEKRKVFRDLTNVGRLMGRKRKKLFFPSSFFHLRVSRFEKPFWKKKFKMSFRLVGLKGEKCAVNEDEKSGKTVKLDSGGEKENVENSSEGAGEHEDGENLCGGRGNGNEGDNNEDENKRNGRTGDEVNDSQHEEDDEDEENETEKEEDNKAEAEAESVEHSPCTEKTEEQSGGRESPSESVSNQEEEGEITNKELVQTDTSGAAELKKENTMEIEKWVDEETQSVESKEQERETREETAKETGKAREEGTEPSSGAETEKETMGLVEGINSETQNVGNNVDCNDREQNLEEGGMTKSKEETTDEEAKEENITKNHEEEAMQVDVSDSATQNEESTNSVAQNEEASISATENEEASVSATENEEASVSATENEEASVSATENEEAVETESKDGIIKSEEVTEIESRDGIIKNEESIKTECKDVATKNEEGESQNTSNEVKMPNNTDWTAESQSSNQMAQTSKRMLREKPVDRLKRRRTSTTTTTTTTAFAGNVNERSRGRRKARETAESRLTIIRRPVQVEPPGPKLGKRNAASTSDEEIVKRFLLHSPSSISITPPRKMAFSRPPSQAAMQALATLRNLKGISATIVRGKPKSEDDVVVIGGSYRRRVEQNSNRKRRQTNVPVISNVQSGDSTTPKIVTVQGNVSGFDGSWAEDGSSQCDSSSIRISNVWGSLPNSFMQSAQNSEAGCSSRQNNPGSSNAVRKKNAKKTVEYVVLE